MTFNKSTKLNNVLRVYIGGAVRDATDLNLSPGAVAYHNHHIVDAGEIDAVLSKAGSQAQVIELSDHLLLPGLVNAHTHLELTKVGYQPYQGNFINWLLMVRSHWPDPDDPLSQVNGDFLATAAAYGAKCSMEAGVLTVGDMSRHQQVFDRVAVSGLRGVCFVELFGLGEPWNQEALQTIATLENKPSQGPLLLGLEPHAPYSAGPSVFHASAQSSLPLSTHLAETEEELLFIAQAKGLFRDLLQDIGKWDDAFATPYSSGQTPVQWMTPYLKNLKNRQNNRWLFAHCNYVTDSDIQLLAESHASVAYCPRASTYFNHEQHRYRDMLEAGVNVCLGTDSIICHGSLSILDEMRFLYQCDQTDSDTLLRMATINGLKGLGLNEKDATFTPNAKSGLIAVKSDDHFNLDSILESNTEIQVQVLECV